MESKKNGIDDLICKAEIETDAEKTYGYQGGKGGMNWEIGTDIYTLLILCIR